jgi:hypothetical protein
MANPRFNEFANVGDAVIILHAELRGPHPAGASPFKGCNLQTQNSGAIRAQFMLSGSLDDPFVITLLQKSYPHF